MATSPDDGGPERGTLVVVFEGSRPACAEAALVLEAKGVPHELAPQDLVAGGDRWALLTDASLADSAREELARYALERRTPPVRPPRIVPLPGAGIGTAFFTGVLLLTAYCTGIQAFGADWLTVGSLDARVEQAKPGAPSRP